MSTDPLDAVGQVIDEKYAVERFVAQGGFSYVYLARHKIWHQAVAIKFLKSVGNARPSERAELLKAFLQEGALLREMSSRTACILQAHDVGGWTASDGTWYPFLVLEWLDGESLEELLGRQAALRAPPWSLDECMTLLEPAARALAVVHERGVSHRDLKPANLFVLGEARAKEAFVKILDFGIAKVVQNVEETWSATQTGDYATSFTPAYGAPEQFSRAAYGPTGPWTDVYAFALILVEMMTLRPCLEGDDVVQLAHASTDLQRRPTPTHKGLHVPPAAEDVFAKAFAVHPRDRFSSMGTFWSALRRSTGRSIVPRAEPAPSMPTVPQALTSTVPRRPSRIVDTRTLYVAGVAVLAVASAATWRFALGGSRSGSGSVPTAPMAPALRAARESAPAAPACPPRMVPIPGSPFFMGYDGPDSLDFEKPVHPVVVSPFCIDRTEVTVAMYKSCSDQGNCPRAGATVDWPGVSASDRQTYGQLCDEASVDRRQHPINCVTWDMARTYCSSISGRLPTSAEWEFAVRGPDGRVYPWGDDPPDRTRLNACGTECSRWGKEHGAIFPTMYNQDDGYPTTAPVGSFPNGRTRYGLDDMIGNVMEWVADWDGPYTRKEEPERDPGGPANGTQRVIRGGAWNASSTNWVRPSFRFHFPPDTRSYAVGFRCAKSLP